jgi:hypothetical protein
MWASDAAAINAIFLQAEGLKALHSVWFWVRSKGYGAYNTSGAYDTS